MTEIVVAEFITLDGAVESSEQWQPPYVSDDVAEALTADIQGAAGSLFGRTTYELMASYWPLQKNNEFGIADKLNSEPKYVVSTTLQNTEWNNSTIVNGNVVDALRKLKQQPGSYIRLVGSPTLAQSLMPTDLIDEYRLYVHPVVRGHGKRLFKDGINQMNLQLIGAKPFSSGVVLMRYRPAAQP